MSKCKNPCRHYRQTSRPRKDKKTFYCTTFANHKLPWRNATSDCWLCVHYIGKLERRKDGFHAVPFCAKKNMPISKIKLKKRLKCFRAGENKNRLKDYEKSGVTPFELALEKLKELEKFVEK